MLELLDGLTNLAGMQLLADVAAAGAETVAEGAAEEEIESLFSIHGLFTLGMLVLLQAVLGFDNLLYISIESKRVREDKQSMVRKLGIGLAIGFRIVLLFVVVNLVKLLEESFFEMDTEWIGMAVSGHSLIVIGGGAFILWTAVKEIYHMIAIPDLESTPGGQAASTVARSVTLIVLMNLVFSFDSILSAMALTKNVWIMAVAIVISGMMMMWLADHVAEFLKKNRMYEVLGLFILFVVGVMLVSDGGHLAQLHLFGQHVTPMAKSTFYFVLTVLIVVEIAQSRYQKKLLAQQAQMKAAA